MEEQHRFKINSFEVKKVRCRKRGCKNMIKPLKMEVFAEIYNERQNHKLNIRYKLVDSINSDSYFRVITQSQLLYKGFMGKSIGRGLIASLAKMKSPLLFCENHQALEKIKR